jgi:hypothetical protein
MKRGALVAWLVSACSQPCPSTPAFCTQIDAGACFAWAAGCCSGIQVCTLGSSIVTDAGACASIPTPASEEIQCD